MKKIFISYRRSDSALMSRRLYDVLVERVGAKRVFRDVDSLLKGKDFRAGIERYIFESDVMLVLIGNKWLDMPDDITGQPRLDNPQDFVRIEVDMGLRHVQTVIPVLVNDASMPGVNDLPPTLAQLSFMNAVQLRDDSFDHDRDVILQAIGIRKRRQWQIVLAAVLLLLTAIAGAVALTIGKDATQETLPNISGADCVHVVQRGENIFRISLRYGVSVIDIAAANGISNLQLLIVNQPLVIPGCGNLPPENINLPKVDISLPSCTNSLSNNDRACAHIVQQEDETFDSLAKRYGVSANDIAILNGLSDSAFISIDQKLIIPPKNISGSSTN